MNLGGKPLQWDIFCRVIDNFGDIGVCWRLAADLAGRGHSVRLWVDDAQALSWMAPGGCAGVTVLDWPESCDATGLDGLNEAPCEVLIESFGCEIAPSFIARCVHIHSAAGLKPLWINLEYLSAQAYVERCHRLPSPVATGPAAGWTKYFFYPGFTELTGGLLREPGLMDRQAAFDRNCWLIDQGVEWNPVVGEKLILLFCYEPPLLPMLLRHLMTAGLDGHPARLLVTAGRAEKAVRSALDGLQNDNNGQIGLKPNQCVGSMLSISYLPLLSQTDFDKVLWACDLNFVRGEDSLVRALWAGKPLIWQIYPQDDGVHSAKLEAFLARIDAPLSLGRFYRAWNTGGAANGFSVAEEKKAEGDAQPVGIALQKWSAHAQTVRSRLLAQPDLTSQLIGFAEKNR